MCPTCRRPVAACVCNQQVSPGSMGDGKVRVSRESKGRGGKAVTVVRGLNLEPEALAALGKPLRAACGSADTVKCRGIIATA